MRVKMILGVLAAGAVVGCAAGGPGAHQTDDRGIESEEGAETVEGVPPGPDPAVSRDTASVTPYVQRRMQEEEERIAACADRVTRNRDTVVVKLRGDSTVSFENVEAGEQSRGYFFAGYLEEIDAFLMEVVYWEGYGYILVDAATGHQTHLDAPPVVSPDRKRLITANMDLEAGYTRTRIQIYRLVDDRLELEWTHEPQDDPRWGPSSAEWIDSVTVSVAKNVPDYSAGISYTRVPIRLRLTENGWILEADTGSSMPPRTRAGPTRSCSTASPRTRRARIRCGRPSRTRRC